MDADSTPKKKSKYIDPAIVLNAIELATKDKENPVYMDYSIIEERAKRANAWVDKLKKINGNVEDTQDS